MSTQNKVYETIKAVALPYMTDYQKDLLVHDKNEIDKYPGVPFIHCTGTTGTHLEMMHGANSPVWPKKGEIVPYLFGKANREHIVKQATWNIPAIKRGNRTSVIQYYDGTDIRTIMFEEYVAIITYYVNDVLKTWSNE